MKNKSYNWSYRDITDFLKENRFSFCEGVEGLDDYPESWVKLGKKGEPIRIVEVDFTTKSYEPETLKKMIDQSGISQEEWIKWAQS